MNKYIKVITKAVSQQNNCYPRFYVIGGSDIYGFKSDVGSDIDIRGFHVSPKELFFNIDKVKEQVIINQDGLTQGFEQYPDIELVSYELRKFGILLSKMNFNILEWLFKGKVIMNGVPLQIDQLKENIEKFLPGNVPFHYLGMSKQNYRKYLDRSNSECYKPTAKKFLYVLRGLYAAKYISENNKIESDIVTLSDKNSLVMELIKIKKKHEKIELDNDIQKEARTLIIEMMNNIEKQEKPDTNTELNKVINKWMSELR